MKLWAHQEKAIRMAAEEFKKGHTSICIVKPTGAGKTHLACAFMDRHFKKNPEGRVVFCAHREELVSQAYDAAASWGLDCGVIQANPTRECNPHRSVQVASTQTLLARGIFPDASMVVLDEVHHYASDKWLQLADEYHKRRIPIIGLTATPIRADGRGFDGFMDALVCPISMKELIKGGFLTPYQLIAPSDLLRSEQIAQSPVDAYLEHARGRKTIVFAGNVKAAEAFRDEFRANGISAEMVHGKMQAGERRRILEAYKNGEIQVLTNVGVLTEGFDDRPTSCVILARSINSLSLYLQMCGRALRCSPETGKTDAVIIDLHGTCHRPDFGEPDADREWTLDGDGVVHKTLEQPTERFCLVCKVLLDPSDGTVCPLCGVVRPEAVPPDVVNAKLVKYAAKLREPEDVRRRYFEKLQAIARDRGYSKWQPHAKYKAIYGEKPPREWT